eukprot:12326903-Ditylum_brightwellii.AAC.1
MHIHPEYNAVTNDLKNDQMIIKLSWESSSNPIQISDGGQILENGEPLQVIGWGVTDTGDISAILQEVSVSYIPEDQCIAVYVDFVQGNMICAVDTKKDSCYGDSGDHCSAKVNTQMKTLYLVLYCGAMAVHNLDILVFTLAFGIELHSRGTQGKFSWTFTAIKMYQHGSYH